MASDPAQHRREDIECVWGPTPRCVLTGVWQFVDPHHVIGRGYDLGAGKSKPERKVFSSILNCVPLCREVHRGPRRDHPLMRRLFLEIAREAVIGAVLAGRYTMRPVDEEFVLQSRQWLRDHPVRDE